MTKPTKKSPVTKPFGPAMNAAVDALTQEFRTALLNLVAAEAQSLCLPKGTQGNLAKREWQLP